jgi:succinate--hydroxymethylglutarate CoA-transferase
LLETQVFSLANIASNWLTAGQEAERLGNAHPSIVPYQTFQAADCELAVGAGNNKQVRVYRVSLCFVRDRLQFSSLCHALGLSSLPDDLRFCSNSQRVVNRVELQRILQAVFQQQNAQHWVQLLNGAGVPAQPINNMFATSQFFIPFHIWTHARDFRQRVFEHEQIRARDMVMQYQHPAFGPVKCVGHPIKFRYVTAMQL